MGSIEGRKAPEGRPLDEWGERASREIALTSLVLGINPRELSLAEIAELDKEVFNFSRQVPVERRMGDTVTASLVEQPTTLAD